jgi:hypothetical protein
MTDIATIWCVRAETCSYAAGRMAVVVEIGDMQSEQIRKRPQTHLLRHPFTGPSEHVRLQSIAAACTRARMQQPTATKNPTPCTTPSTRNIIDQNSASEFNCSPVSAYTCLHKMCACNVHTYGEYLRVEECKCGHHRARHQVAQDADGEIRPRSAVELEQFVYTHHFYSVIL